jgi:hypothetical protein
LTKQNACAIFHSSKLCKALGQVSASLQVIKENKMIDQLEDVLGLDEAYLTRAIAQEVLGIDHMVPEGVNEDGLVLHWISDEQERAVDTGQFTWSMDAALGLLRGSSEQLSSAQRQRLMHSAANCLAHILEVSNCEADGVLFEAITRLTPLPVVQAFLAAWRHESEIYGTLPFIDENCLEGME